MELTKYVILERDWMVANGVLIYYDSISMRIRDIYVPLEENLKIATIARLRSNIILKPQTANTCFAFVKEDPRIDKEKIYQITQIESCYVNTEPGLMLSNSVIPLDKF